MPDQNTDRLPAWEDPEVVGYQFTREIGANKTRVLRPIQLGLKGKELGLDANAINEGISSRKYTAFPLEKGGMIVKVNTYNAEGAGDVA